MRVERVTDGKFEFTKINIPFKAYSKCSVCKEEAVYDFTVDWLMYAIPGKPYDIQFNCPTCRIHWGARVVFDVSLRAYVAHGESACMTLTWCPDPPKGWSRMAHYADFALYLHNASWCAMREYGEQHRPRHLVARESLEKVLQAWPAYRSPGIRDGRYCVGVYHEFDVEIDNTLTCDGVLRFSEHSRLGEDAVEILATSNIVPLEPEPMYRPTKLPVKHFATDCGTLCGAESTNISTESMDDVTCPECWKVYKATTGE